MNIRERRLVMRKFSVFLFSFVLILVTMPVHASLINLVQNPSFELNNAWSSPADFDNWQEYGNYGVTSYARTGSYAARLGDNTNWSDPSAYAYSNLYSDPINIAAPGTYEFGAWFALKSSTDPTSDYNSDKP